MVYRKYEVLDALFDDFGLSDGSDSEEEGEDIYAYVGEPILLRDDIEAIGDSVIVN